MFQATVGVTTSGDKVAWATASAVIWASVLRFFSTFPISGDPETFLAGSIESGILSLTLRSGSELKMKAFSANGHSVIYGNHFVLGASHDSFPIVLVLWLQGQQLWDFRVALIQRDNGISVIYVPNQIFSINSNQELTKRGRKTARSSGECNHEMGITTRNAILHRQRLS